MIDRLFDVALLTTNERRFLSSLAGDDSNTPEANSYPCTAESADSETSCESIGGLSVGRMTDSWLGYLCVDYGILEPSEVEVCEFEALIQCRGGDSAGTRK